MSLLSGWKGTPILLEAAEFLAAEHPRKYWDYVEAWENVDSWNASESCWEEVHRKASQGLRSGLPSVLTLSLAMREYSAKLEMYRRVAEAYAPPAPVCCWASVGAAIVTSHGDLETAILSAKASNGQPQVFRFDHQLPWSRAVRDSSLDGVVVVLYASPGTSCFREFHSSIKAILQQSPGQVTYVHRPVFSEGCQGERRHPCVDFGTKEKLQLPGFGVEMAIKSVEYSAVDDAKKDVEAPVDTADGYGVLKGFDFDVLVARRPHLREELLTFKASLESTLSGDEGLKVWEMKDLGLQASQRILQAADPLSLMVEISQNFPVLASSLSRLHVDPDLRERVTNNQKVVPSRMSLMLLNGMPVDVDELDLYEFLKRVRNEVSVRETLLSMGLSSTTIGKFLRFRADDNTDGIEQLRFNVVPAEHVIFLNNLEKDSMYGSYPTSLNSLLNPFFPAISSLWPGTFTLLCAYWTLPRARVPR